MLITPKSKNMEKESRLSKATEALVEAALLDAGTASQKELASKLEALQISFDNKLNTVIQTQKASDLNFDDKINTLNQHLVDLKKDMRTMSSSIQEENKQKTLERALSMADVDSFYYYDYQEGQNISTFLAQNVIKRYNSAKLAKEVIKRFMLDRGYYVPKAAIGVENREETDEETKAFRDKFKELIKFLIKREPRLEQESDGRFCIWYS